MKAVSLCRLTLIVAIGAGVSVARTQAQQQEAPPPPPIPIEKPGNQAVEDAKKVLAVPPGMVKVDIPLGFANADLVRQSIDDIKSAGGAHVILSTRRILRIVDTPQTIEAVKQIVKALSVPPKNVKVEITAMAIGGGRTTTATFGPGPSGSGTAPGPVRTRGGRIVLPKGGVDVGLSQQQTTTSSLNKSFILVQSGSNGALEVVRDVPMVDYFTRFIAGEVGPMLIQGPGNFVQQIFPGGEFRVPEIRWEKAGTRLLVKPTVSGDLITVEVIPQISAVVIANPQKLQARGINTHLTGRDQYVSFTRLKTTVTVQNGATVTIGGFANASPEFNAAFYGHRGAGMVRSSGGGAGSITLRATVQ